MKKVFQKLHKFIQNENRELAVKEALELLDANKTTIKELYQDGLAVSLQEIDCKDGDKECIWKEHIRTAIVRTVIELCYPYVLKETKKSTPNNKTVLVMCPPEEYHEIGAKMVHDFFLMSGYTSRFIGANTPLDVILSAVELTTPEYIALSVTNYYNVVQAKRIVKAIKEVHNDVVVLVGGQAIKDKETLVAVGADYHLTTFESIGEL